MSLKFIGVGLCEWLFVFRTPEDWSKKRESAEVDTADISDFVSAARIVSCINRHILADDKARQGNWHHRAVQHSVAESGSFVFRERPR